uniref:Uncharacterized protein n=1 Tax=Kalanchoe fedtschenkoi TaxID=63787 RepID=A0A7N0UQX7_KALFE
MERKCSSAGELLEAIKSSDVVENRSQLVEKLRELELCDKSDLASVAEALTIFWEDFTCLDVSQCILNRAILQVAAKYVDSDTPECLEWHLILCTKASKWCGKHLSMTLLSTEDSQEKEHSSMFYQLLQFFLNLAATTFSAMARHPIIGNQRMTDVVEPFFIEQLGFTRECVSESKRLYIFGSEVLKSVQGVLNGAVQVCKAYSQSINWDTADGILGNNACETYNEEAAKAIHAVSIIHSTIEKLCEIGVLAANDGGNLVTVLNVSWKGVVNLLQLCKGALAVRVKVPDIILTLISLATESLRCAAKAWSGLSEDGVSVTEARKTFLPVKFYLINATRISSQYPNQAFLVSKEIIKCVLKISTFRLCLSREPLTVTASEVLTELLAQTSLDLINSLLNSDLLRQEMKFEILDWLFPDDFGPRSGNEISPGIRNKVSMEVIFSVKYESNEKTLLLGRVILLLEFLKCLQLEEDGRMGITRKLGWLLDALVDEEIYASIFILQIPTVCHQGTKVELVWQSLYFYVLDALKISMLLFYPTIGWEQYLSFLLENIFHPHFLAWEIVMELCCFMIRHAEMEFVNDLIDKLCVLYKSLAYSDPSFSPSLGLRKMARLICMLLSNELESTADRVYKFAVEDDKSEASSVMFVALLMEGLDLGMLSDDIKTKARSRIMADYIGYLECFDDTASASVLSGLQGSPVLALSASIQSIHVNTIDIDSRTLKFLVSVIRYYRSTEDRKLKDLSRKLLSETLSVVSRMNYLYESDDMDNVIVELQNLFVSSKSSRDGQLYKCKPYLALFMAGVGHMTLAEGDESARGTAIGELYHMLLRERHWAFVHLAISAFGCFASRTTCKQLWRFLPTDATLSFDLGSGLNANEEMFMHELKAILDKETTVFALNFSLELQMVLIKEGLVLKELLNKIVDIDPEAMLCEEVNTETEKHTNKRRKLPENISKGVELLQSGLKVIGDGLSQWQPNESDEFEKILTHFSCLEDVIGHLSGLAGSE